MRFLNGLRFCAVGRRNAGLSGCETTGCEVNASTAPIATVRAHAAVGKMFFLGFICKASESAGEGRGIESA